MRRSSNNPPFLFRRAKWLLRSSQTMRHSTKKLLLGAIMLPAFSIALAGCMVGPDYAPPKVEHPQAFRSPATTQPATSIPTEWWRLFNDPQLDGLIKLAGESNQ